MNAWCKGPLMLLWSKRNISGILALPCSYLIDIWCGGKPNLSYQRRTCTTKCSLEGCPLPPHTNVYMFRQREVATSEWASRKKERDKEDQEWCESKGRRDRTEKEKEEWEEEGEEFTCTIYFFIETLTATLHFELLSGNKKLLYLIKNCWRSYGSKQMTLHFI